MPETANVTNKAVTPAKRVKTEPVIADTIPVTKYMAVTMPRQKRDDATRADKRIFWKNAGMIAAARAQESMPHHVKSEKKSM